MQPTFLLHYHKIVNKIMKNLEKITNSKGILKEKSHGRLQQGNMINVE